MSSSCASTVPPHRLWWLALGFGLWSFAFVALYALHALGCAYGWSDPLLRLGMTGLLAATVAALGFALSQAPRSSPGDGTTALIGRAARWTLWAAMIGAIFTFAPALALTACR